MSEYHSEVSPSGLGPLLATDDKPACLGKVKLSRDIPEPPSGAAAEEGTKAHAAAEESLLTGWPASDAFVRHYVDYVKAIDGELLVEERFDLSMFYPGMSGSADACIWNADTKRLDVVDLKYGMMRVNMGPQLFAYGLGALMRFDEAETIGLHIVQPRIEHVAAVTVTPSDLLEFGDKLKALHAAVEAESPTLAPHPDNCRFCKAYDVCPAVKQQVIDTVGEDFDSLPDPDGLTDHQISLVLKNQTMITDWMKRVVGIAQARAADGNPVEGTKLVRTTKNRIWGANAEEKLTAALGDEAFVTTKKLIGIGAAEKMLGKAAVAELAERPQGTLLCVPADDKRDAVDPALDFD